MTALRHALMRTLRYAENAMLIVGADTWALITITNVFTIGYTGDVTWAEFFVKGVGAAAITIEHLCIFYTQGKLVFYEIGNSVFSAFLTIIGVFENCPAGIY